MGNKKMILSILRITVQVIPSTTKDHFIHYSLINFNFYILPLSTNYYSVKYATPSLIVSSIASLCVLSKEWDASTPGPIKPTFIS